MGLLGGKLKRMELLSARLGDVLAHLYMASACVWRYKVIQVDDFEGPARKGSEGGEGRALSPPLPTAQQPAQSTPRPSARRPERTTPPPVPAA
jgi:hypothetical protein